MIVLRLRTWASLVVALLAGCSTGRRNEPPVSAGESSSLLSSPPASAIDRSVATTVGPSTSFLYTGTSPIQTGVASGTIVASKAAVIRGHVFANGGSPIVGATVTVVNHPEFGSTLTQTDGEYDLAVNGGQSLRLHYALAQYLPAERLVQAPLQDYVTLDDVILLQTDTQVTAVNVSSSSSDIQVARGSAITDTSGSRRATLFFPAGVQATMTLPNGSTTHPSTINVRATEYTVGTQGPAAMPAGLPLASAYTYTTELTADEALTAGATQLTFSTALSFYVENFIGLPIGTSVPIASYDPTIGAWRPATSGLILKILSVTNAMANLDVNGDGVVDTGATLTAIGLTDSERAHLASLYSVGQSLWRMPIQHFTSWSASWDNGPPTGAADNACASYTCTAGDGVTPIACEVALYSIQCGSQTPDPCSQANYCATHGFPSTIDFGGCDLGTPQNCYRFCCPVNYGPSAVPRKVCEAHNNAPAASGQCSSPGSPAPPDGNGPGGCQDSHASTISCQRQSLGEDIPIPGTPYALHYESDRQRGRQLLLSVPVSGSTVPTPVTGIELRAQVAGRLFVQSFNASANRTTTFTWDGLDAYGRLLQGAQPISIEIRNLYPGVYQNTDVFGVTGTGLPIINSVTRQPFIITQAWKGTIEAWDAQPQGLGGWTLDVHHVYDVSGRVLRFGDGTNRSVIDVPAIIQIVAGNGQPGFSGDGGPATSATLRAPQSVAPGPDGSFVYADAFGCVRKIGTDGIIRVFAGQCGTFGFSGDGGAATAAKLALGTRDVAYGPDGSLYIADTNNSRIRRVGGDGIIQTVAGSGSSGFGGDGGPALQAVLNRPTGIDVSNDGTIYIADRDNNRIRSVSPDGIIRTTAGTGSASANANGNGGPAKAAPLNSPVKVRVGKDGSFYIAESAGNVVRRVGPDGIIRAFAGTGNPGSGGIGTSATAADLLVPRDIALGPDGAVYIVDGNNTVQQVASTGAIRTLVGNASKFNFTGDGGFAAAATMGLCAGLRVGPDGGLYIGCQDNRIRRVQPALANFSAATLLQIPSTDGRQVYEFDGTGRHQRTRDALTGVAIYQFSYDTAGRLTSVTDVDSNVTQIKHDGSGNLTSIVGPFGQQTTFTPDTHGYLKSALDPAGNTTQFTYDANGLMQTRTDARNGLSQYTHDAAGRLSKDTDSAGGFKSLTRTENSDQSFDVGITTRLGHTTTFRTQYPFTSGIQRSTTLPSGRQASFSFGFDGASVTTVPDGTRATTTVAPDQRFGVQAPLLTTTRTTPGARNQVQSLSRTVVLSNQADPLSLTSLTEQRTLNGNTWSSVYDASTRTWTTTSPRGRKTFLTLDPHGHVASSQVDGLSSVTFSYNARGLLTGITQGTRSQTIVPGSDGFPSTVTDALSQTTTLHFDGDGRLQSQTLADQTTTTALDYDLNGNLKSVTPPGKPSHGMTYTAVDLLHTYDPPPVAGGAADGGTGTPSTIYDYDFDRMLHTTTRPDGIVITNTPDFAGRLQTVALPAGTLTYNYSPTTGQVTSISGPGSGADAETIAFGYDGALRTDLTYSGAVTGTVHWDYNSDFRVSQETVNGGFPASFEYDADGLLTSAGKTAGIVFTRSPVNGLVSGSSVGPMSDTYTPDSFGALSAHSSMFSTATWFSESITLRDALGRIKNKTESVKGTTSHSYVYTYDIPGRLTDVQLDGINVGHYEYDGNGNRTKGVTSAGTAIGVPDSNDRLISYGTAVYQYSANGELQTKTVAGQTTSYTYDALGNLKHVGLPGGPNIDYVVDGLGRRVGKRVNGTLVKGFLWSDQLRIVAQLDGAGNMVSRFVYGARQNVPEYMVTPGVTSCAEANFMNCYRLVTDHLGSVRLVVRIGNSSVVQRIDYDEFGVVTNDTNPGFQPFGFAGGLYDPDTKLVRFGMRDYDASIGRWTAKDPIRFSGGSLNLYGYVLNDPVNMNDPTGLSFCDWLPWFPGCGDGGGSGGGGSDPGDGGAGGDAGGDEPGDPGGAGNIPALEPMPMCPAYMNQDKDPRRKKRKKESGCHCYCIDVGFSRQDLGRVGNPAICTAACSAIPSIDPSRFPNGRKGECE